MNQRILILDTSAILHQVKFSLAKHKLSNKEKPTFVIYGFLLKLSFLLKKTKSNVVVFATDSLSSKRKKMYAEYKEKRSQNKTEQQIALDKLAYPQFDEIINYVIPKLGYRNVFGAEGFEADDVIGRVCKTYKDSEIIICTTDQDMYQLLKNNVAIFDIRINNWFTEKSFKTKFGIEPKMWKRVKAIGGCSSDNVKGVPIPQPDPTKKMRHVAETGALNFIIGKMNPNTQAYKAIVSKAGKQVINRNKKLVILPFKDTPEFPIRPDHPRRSGFIDVCEKYDFKSLLSDMDYWKNTLRLR